MAAIDLSGIFSSLGLPQPGTKAKDQSRGMELHVPDWAKNCVNDIPEELNFDVVTQTMEAEMQRMHKLINDNVMKNMREQLAFSGFDFKDEQELYAFIRQRVTAIGNISRTDEYSLYVDYGTFQQIELGVLYHPARIMYQDDKMVGFEIGQFRQIKPIIPGVRLPKPPPPPWNFYPAT